MILTTHATIAILISRVIPNPILSFILGFISHYLIDIIPHDRISDDEELNNKIKSGELDFKKQAPFKKFLLVCIVDGILLVSMVFYIFYNNLTLNPVSAGAAIIGSILPDFMWLPFSAFKWKLFKPFFILNNKCHDIIKYDPPLWLGFSLQIIFIGVILYLLYFR